MDNEERRQAWSNSVSTYSGRRLVVEGIKEIGFLPLYIAEIVVDLAYGVTIPFRSGNRIKKGRAGG